MATSTNRIIQVLESSQVQLLADWVKALRSSPTSRTSTAISDPELQAQCQEFITLFGNAIRSGNLEDIEAPAWKSSCARRGDRARPRRRARRG
jgi:hypothetical protein